MGFGQLVREIGQALAADGLFLREIDDVVAMSVVEKLLFRRLHLDLELPELRAKELASSIRGIEFTLEVLLDELLGEDVDHPGRELGIGRGVADLDQTGIAHRLGRDSCRQPGSRRGVLLFGSRLVARLLLA